MITGQTIQKTIDGPVQKLPTKKLPLKLVEFETEPSESYSPFLKHKITQKGIPWAPNSANQLHGPTHSNEQISIPKDDCQVTTFVNLNPETYSQKFYDDLDLPFNFYTTSTVSCIDVPLQDGRGLLGGQEYLAKIKALDSLGEQKFIEVTQKLSESTNGLFWDFSKISESNMIYSPNSLLIPSKNFILEFKIQSIKQANKFPQPFTLSINTNNTQFKQVRVESLVGDIKVEIDCSCLTTQAQKQKQIDQVNFKVNEKLYLNSDLIKLKRLRISLKSTNYQNTEEETNVLIQELKTQQGSKEYQKQIQSMELTQIEKMISKIENNLADLINNEYANYFIQSIFPLLSPHVKLTFLIKLKPSINTLIASSHGTFVFQSFLDFTQTQQHYMALIEGILDKFIELSIDSNASHFLRKLIKTMPQDFLENFCVTEQDFLQLSNNRYGVCVLKNIYRRLVSHQSASLRQYFLYIVKNNLEALAAGEYSNYLIQDIYNSYGEQELHNLSIYISRKPFLFLSTKFSIIILTKCIKQYWKSESLYTQYLSENLDTHNIIWTRQSQRLIQQIIYLKQRKAGGSIKGYKGTPQKKAPRKYIST